ncbi:MAG: phytoene/squalene synthase family protein [Terrimicrobiaceae bacterium]
MKGEGGNVNFDWPLLKQVSRSFYLTLRLLPEPVREPISLAYLLARLSDTEADGAVTDAEKELLARRPELESWLAVSPDREEIAKVWTTIREGQRFDGERFDRADSPPLSEEELDRYTYLVAGCVGEFWTDICAKKLPGFSKRPPGEMRSLGVRFGKGLQLVNILRDRRADARLGRVYVPDTKLAGQLALAREHLDAAECYVRALKIRRLRTACALPFLMGRETLDLVEKSPDRAGVKISRNRVWFLLLRSFSF